MLMQGLLSTALACVLASDAPITRPADDVLPPLAALVGTYAVIGQQPEGGASYAGTATVSLDGSTLRLQKTIADTVTTATACVGDASPGEAEVLRIAGPGFEQTCLVRFDLDNYARLTCQWSLSGAAPGRPGLEAYFATGGWRATEP